MMQTFTSATIMTAATDETGSLEKTIKTIIKTCSITDLKEFIIIVCKKTTEECRRTAESFTPEYCGVPVRVIDQTLPGLGGALRCAMENSTGSHTLLIPADEGIDLDAPARMIELAKEHPDKIISTSRWMEGCSFEGYAKTKLIFNYLAQIFLRILYRQMLTDMTNPSQIAPVSVYNNILWDSTDYNLMLEMVLKPIRMGVKFIEIPTNCHERTEGQSGNSFMKTFAYLGTALKIRFTPKKKFLKNPYPEL